MDVVVVALVVAVFVVVVFALVAVVVTGTCHLPKHSSSQYF